MTVLRGTLPSFCSKTVAVDFLSVSEVLEVGSFALELVEVPNSDSYPCVDPLTDGETFPAAVVAADRDAFLVGQGVEIYGSSDRTWDGPYFPHRNHHD
jgi:hypothetical protein